MPHNQSLHGRGLVLKGNQLSYLNGFGSTEERTIIFPHEMNPVGCTLSNGTPEALLTIEFNAADLATVTYNYRPLRSHYHGKILQRYFWYGSVAGAVDATRLIKAVNRESPIIKNQVIAAGSSGPLDFIVPIAYVAKTVLVTEVYSTLDIDTSIEVIGYRFGRNGSHEDDVYTGNFHLVAIEFVYIEKKNTL